MRGHFKQSFMSFVLYANTCSCLLFVRLFRQSSFQGISTTAILSYKHGLNVYDYE